MTASSDPYQLNNPLPQEGQGGEPPGTRRTPAAGETGVRQERPEQDTDTTEGTTASTSDSVYLTLRVPLPQADQAERDLAGCAVANPAAVHLALERVSYAHFRDARCWEAIVAATRPHHDANLDERIYSVAAYLEAEPALVRQWVDDRPVMFDKSGALARKIAAAANARLEVLDLVERLQALGAEVIR